MLFMNSILFMSHHTGSSVLPVNISVDSVSQTAISVQWNILMACSSSTKDIVIRCRVQYYDTSGEVEAIDVIGELSEEMIEIFLNGLTPYTNYSIQIAIVDEQGVAGAFTHPITMETKEDG